MMHDAKLINAVAGIESLNVPRIEDLPYATSPPVQFVYQSTAPLVLGAYTWADTPAPLLNDRPILENAIYYLRDITLTADIESLDFSSNIATLPDFQLFVQSEGGTVLFRESIKMPIFLDQFNYRLAWWTYQGQSSNQGATFSTKDALRGGFFGALTQGSNLVGKNDVTLTAVISAQEIIDDGFIMEFKKQYPTKNNIKNKLAGGR